MAYGQAHVYNYKDGWRSYSLHTVGELRTLLRMVTTRDGLRVSNELGHYFAAMIIVDRRRKAEACHVEQ